MICRFELRSYEVSRVKPDPTHLHLFCISSKLAAITQASPANPSSGSSSSFSLASSLFSSWFVAISNAVEFHFVLCEWVRNN